MSGNTIITLKLSRPDEEKLYQAFAEYEAKTPPYARFQLRPLNCVITCYESGKTVFQGKDAEVYASAFMQETAETEGVYPQAGSDEVGTGDYFGPVCVCAAIVKKQDVSFLTDLGVRDSKKLTDEKMREIAPMLMERLKYSLLIVDNSLYNRVHAQTNMNAIKARLHNQAYINLSRKEPLPSFLIIDQFTPEKSYYNYLKQEKQIIRGIHFETHAEDQYLSVGAGSIISRYAFLKSMDAMEEKYDMEFVKGAGSAVDECGARFVSRYGMDRLGEVAKLHFKNTEKIKSLAE